MIFYVIYFGILAGHSYSRSKIHHSIIIAMTPPCSHCTLLHCWTRKSYYMYKQEFLRYLKMPRAHPHATRTWMEKVTLFPLVRPFFSTSFLWRKMSPQRHPIRLRMRAPFFAQCQTLEDEMGLWAGLAKQKSIPTTNPQVMRMLWNIMSKFKMIETYWHLKHG